MTRVQSKTGPRRARSDSTQGQREAIEAAKPEVPAHMTLLKRERPYWDSIIDARSADQWTAPDLELAVFLARGKCQLDSEYQQLRKEGLTITNDKGARVANPREAALDRLEKRVLAMSAKLHVQASATIGRPADTGNRTKAQKQTRANAQGAADDDLIARPVRRVK